MGEVDAGVHHGNDRSPAIRIAPGGRRKTYSGVWVDNPGRLEALVQKRFHWQRRTDPCDTWNLGYRIDRGDRHRGGMDPGWRPGPGVGAKRTQVGADVTRSLDEDRNTGGCRDRG